jgi:serine phosphatase RsbU (regulator of sigma subunit)
VSFVETTVAIIPDNNTDALSLDITNSNATDTMPVLDLECLDEVASFADLQGQLEILQNRLAQSKILQDQLNQLNAQLYERNTHVEKELYIARQLQQSLLPPIIKTLNDQDPSLSEDVGTIDDSNLQPFEHCHFRNQYLNIMGVYMPCDALGGDLYDVLPFNDGSIGVSVADVSGHGVPAGFITAIYKAAFYRMTNTYQTPWDIMFHLNNELMDIVKTGDYITSFYSKLTPMPSLHGAFCDKPPRYKMDYAGAGHPYPFVYRAPNKQHPQGFIERLDKNSMPLIWVKEIDYPQATVMLYPGDSVLLFTDGVSEMKNTRNDIFGEPALESLLLQYMQQRTQRRLDAIINYLSDFTEGHPLEDDLSIVLLEIS